MPDTATAPEIKPTEILASTQREVQTPTFAGTETEAQKKLREAHEKAGKIRELQSQHPEDLKKQLVEVTEVGSFSEQDLESTKSLLSSEQAKTAAEGITPLIKYLEAARKARINRSEVATELGANADEILKKTAELLITRGNLLEKFSDLKDAFEGNDNALRGHVEDLIARDPRFQNELVKELKRIRDEAHENLRSDPQAEELERTKTEKGDVEELQDQQTEIIKTQLEARSVPADRIDAILKTINTGDAGFAISRTVDSIIDASGIQNVSYLDAYRQDASAVRTAETERTQLEQQLNQARRGKQNPQTAELIKSLDDQILRKGSAIDDLKQKQGDRKNNYESTFNVDDAGFEAQLQSLDEARAMLNPENSLNRAIQYATSNGQRLKELTRQVSTLESNTELTQRVAQRENDREKLSSALENAVGTAIGRFLEKKYDDYVSSQNVLIRASEKEAEKKGEKWLAESTKKLKEAMDKWGKFNPKTRKMELDRGNIGKSIRELAANSATGEDGSRKNVAKIVNFELDPEKAREQIAIDIKGEGTTFDSLTDIEKANAEALLKKRTADFEKLYSEHGVSYKERLTAAFFEARRAHDINFLGKNLGELSLTGDEWKILDSQFGLLIEQKLQSSKDGQKVMQDLRERGIVPDKKLKWLLWILLTLGVGAAGFVAAPAAAAAIGAVKSAGSAF